MSNHGASAQRAAPPDPAPARRDWRGAATIAVDLILLLIVAAGVVARIVALPRYVADSGDEWGNTIAPLRMLFDRGDPGTFFHPSLFYDVTACVYAAVFGAVKAVGIGGGAVTMTDLFVLDERYFVYAARAVSVASAMLAMWALYALARSLWGRASGLTAAALLAVLPVHAIYSEAVRVDSFFLAVFIYAFSRIVRIVQEPRRAPYESAGLWTGLAIGANYNGVILVPWLIAAHVLNASSAPPQSSSDAGGAPVPRRHPLFRALAMALVAFAVSSPFLFADFATASEYVAFISGLTITEHVGIEGRGVLFYARALLQSLPYLAATIAVACAAIVRSGNRTERFVLSLPVAYAVLFSLMQTKFDRFILPAMALFLLVISGLPAVLARRAHRSRMASAAACALLAICLATMMPHAIPIPDNGMQPRADGVLLEWIERNVPPRSRVLVEAGLLPIIDVTTTCDPLGHALRRSLIRARPNLDQQFVVATYVGHRSGYGEPVDYAIISPRNVRYVWDNCETYPDVCAFYRGLRGRRIYETPPGVEGAAAYDVRVLDPADTTAAASRRTP